MFSISTSYYSYQPLPPPKSHPCFLALDFLAAVEYLCFSIPPPANAFSTADPASQSRMRRVGLRLRRGGAVRCLLFGVALAFL